MQGLSLAEEQGFLSACIILSSRYESTQRICNGIFFMEDTLGTNIFDEVWVLEKYKIFFMLKQFSLSIHGGKMLMLDTVITALQCHKLHYTFYTKTSVLKYHYDE